MSASRREPGEPRASPKTAYELGVRLLARREQSSLQIRQKLADRGFDDAAIDAAVQRLTEQGALDDRRMALAVARRAAMVRLRGRRRIERDLQVLGIPVPLIDDVLRELFAEVDETQLLERALERCLRVARSSQMNQTARAYRQLVARGFDPEAVQTILEQRRQTPRNL